MPDGKETPLLQALAKKRMKMADKSESDNLLKMILEQVTKVADYFATDAKDDKNEIVVTQESHTP